MPGRRTENGNSRAAFAEFRARVDEAREKIGFDRTSRPEFGACAGEDCLYRGHCSQAYVLQPTLIRAAQSAGIELAVKGRRGAAKARALAELQDIEAQLFYEFAPRGKKLASGIASDWDLLFLMRHHTVATRLLDWTQSFGVALYFALCPWLNDRARLAGTLSDSSFDPPVVWLLNPYRLNQRERTHPADDILAPRFLNDPEDGASYGDWLGEMDDPGMGWQLPRAIFPETLNDRLHAQHGLFTIHGDLHDPLDALVGGDVARCVQLPKQALLAALEFLSDAGICESALFPDLDALARDLHRKYGLG